MREVARYCAILACSLIFTAASYGQSVNLTNPPDAAPAAATPNHHSSGDSGRFGFGIKGSLLGGGIEAAARVTHHINARGGFNMFTYSRDFTKDQATYSGQLSFKTVEGHLDYFPFAGRFHVSPGVLIYAGDPITASATFSTANSFTLGGQTYYSDPLAPATGKGKIDFNRAAPVATIGFGNLVPRKAGKHFSVPVEFGVAFQGPPKATLNVTGNLCTQQGVESSCANAATNPTILSNIVSEQDKFNHSARFFKVYPIISVGFGYKF